MPNNVLPHKHKDNVSIDSAISQVKEIQNFQIAADFFKLLGDSSRIRIFWLLCHCEECVINISALVEMSSPAVSHHLRHLKASGLIISRREGKEMYYSAAGTEQSRLFHSMIENMLAITCPDFEKNS